MPNLAARLFHFEAGAWRGTSKRLREKTVSRALTAPQRLKPYLKRVRYRSAEALRTQKHGRRRLFRTRRLFRGLDAGFSAAWTLAFPQPGRLRR
ncbi:MAG: hypothetical protein WB817_05945 [Terriglobales bacterium]